MPPEEEPLHLLDGSLHRRQLKEDIHAVLVFLNHALYSLHLPLDAPKPAEGLAPSLIVDHVCSSLAAARLVPSAFNTHQAARATVRCLSV